MSAWWLLLAFWAGGAVVMEAVCREAPSDLMDSTGFRLLYAALWPVWLMLAFVLTAYDYIAEGQA